ncbi:MAG: LAGLIDADG family homing endonuclease [Nitrososphaerales archaeon]
MATTGSRRKQISPKERKFAWLIAEGLSPRDAAVKAFGWKCETYSEETTKAYNLAKTQRVKDEVAKIRKQLKAEADAETTLITSDGLDKENLRKFCYQRLEEIRDDPNKPAKARFDAIKALEKLSDPATDVNLIWRWIDVIWRGAKAHCPCCHKSFPMWKIRNSNLEEYRQASDKGYLPPEEEDEFTRRMELIRMADRRKRPHIGQIRALAAPERHLVGKGAARAGKVLAPNTSVLTTKGWKRYEDLDYSDTLFDENGNKCNIVGFSPVCETGKWYKVIFDNGEEIIAHENHEWVTHDYSYRSALSRRHGIKPNKNTTLEPTLITTKEIKKTLKVRNGTHTNHGIPVCGPLKFESKELPLHPYLLGIWLGDGTSINPSITTTDPEIIDKIKRLGYTVTKKTKSCWYVKGIKHKFTLLDLIGNKYIPNDYLFSSIDQRKELLRGLMDSDGTIDSKGRCGFDNTNKNLVDGTRFLLNSLGIKTNKVSKVRQPRLNGESYSPITNKKYKLCYRLNFTTTLPIFSLERKLKRIPTEVKKTVDYHYIYDVLEVPSFTGRCIEVDSSSNLYLCSESLIPTHNSFLLAHFAFMGLLIPGVEIWILAEVYESARSEVEYLRGFIKSLFYPLDKYMIKERIDHKSGEMILTTRWGSELRIKSAKAKGSVTGRELEMCLIAEPAWVPDDLYEEVRARMSSRLGRILAFGTPKGYGGLLARMVNLRGVDPNTGKVIRTKPEDRLIENGAKWSQSMLVYNLSPEQNPEYVKSELEAARLELTEEEYAAEFRGEMKSDEGAKFPHINEKHIREVKRSEYEKCMFIQGVDQGPKNFGACLVGYDGDKIYMCREYFDNSEDTIKANLLKLRLTAPLLVEAVGGSKSNFNLTIFDDMPKIDGILAEMAVEGTPWPTPINFKHKNEHSMQENWREETAIWVNQMALQGKIVFDNECDQLLWQVIEVMNKPALPDKEKKAGGSDKGWHVRDPFRGDHVLDAWLMVMWTILSGQVEMAEADYTVKKGWDDHKAAFEYKIALDEAEELHGSTNKKADEAKLFEEHFGRPRKGATTFFPTSGYYKDY